MPDLNEMDNEARRRSLALEGAMMLLIDGLAARGTISIDEAEDSCAFWPAVPTLPLPALRARCASLASLNSYGVATVFRRRAPEPFS
ncbi:hypothetical protein SAMN03159496_04729 [Rhizobium sp. NFR07]|uniref:hypothetical protein n=1 Tax=Rhizobium sp. NFR07 TaxID=1566262 RepID=UPI0008F31535|nr:hypothetical protein [Rhizobium sp. NFR07]SFB52989.1 hypothetical protein SAMN03159496_04729 [Rhizobium sp. NFR07]